jgi:hypothetical protein
MPGSARRPCAHGQMFCLLEPYVPTDCETPGKRAAAFPARWRGDEAADPGTPSPPPGGAPLGNLGLENALQPAPESRRDPNVVVQGLDGSLEFGRRDVAGLRTRRATRVPPDAAEVAEAALGDGVVELRATLRADQRALQVVIVLPAALAAGGVRVEDRLHSLEQLPGNERGGESFLCRPGAGIRKEDGTTGPAVTAGQRFSARWPTDRADRADLDQPGCRSRRPCRPRP